MEPKQKQISELTVEELKDALINGQRFILRVPQVQNEIAVIEQELAKRAEKPAEPKE
jgi:hypothetical protein